MEVQYGGVGEGLPVARWHSVIAGNWFSPILFNNPGSEHEVTGERHSLDDSALPFLDDLDGGNATDGALRHIWALASSALDQRCAMHPGLVRS